MKKILFKEIKFIDVKYNEFKIHKVNTSKSVLKYDLNKISSYIFNKYKFISNLK